MRESLFLFIFLFGIAAQAREFTVMVYNVENLFDADGVALYDDYKEEKYSPSMLATKVENIARVLKNVNNGVGPDIVVFNEIEVDQTSETTVKDYDKWLEDIADKRAGDLLCDEDGLTFELSGAPSEAWLLKACEDAGLKGYRVIVGENFPTTTKSGSPISVKNVIFSRFPVKDARLLPLEGARPILEVRVDIEGHPLTIFANHWKSGASDSVSENARMSDAHSLRKRLDEIFQEDPNADVLIAGDLNSHYNQNRRYRHLRQTAINDVLGSQGNVLAMRGKERDLYNLWFDLPSNQRGSDIYQNEWGTLMHLILSRGLYDHNAVQYIDKSFFVLKIPKLNSDIYGAPRRWWFSVPNGSGFSDHFPIVAHFRTVETGDKTKWIVLSSPSQTADGPEDVERAIKAVDLFRNALDVATLGAEEKLRKSYEGRICKIIDAPARIDEGTGFLRVSVRGEDYDIFTHDRKVRAQMVEIVETTGQLSLYGEVGTYRGRWQFLLHGPEWLLSTLTPVTSPTPAQTPKSRKKTSPTPIPEP